MSVYKDIKTGLEQAIAYEKENNIKKEKAILVIDMPKSCKNCMCYVLGAKNNFCEVTRFAIFDSTTKPSHCPLKPAPEEQEVWFDDERSDWVMGYNNCVREIMGSEEDYEF